VTICHIYLSAFPEHHELYARFMWEIMAVLARP